MYFAFLLFVSTLVTSSLALYDEDVIKCEVCVRSVTHMWEAGAKIRAECALQEHATRDDDKCFFGDITEDVIHKLVDGACAEIPHTTKMIENEKGVLKAVLHDNPGHEPEVIAQLEQICRRWVHEANTVHQIANHLWGNLRVGKKAEHILMTFFHEFCWESCGQEKPTRRRQRKHIDPGEPEIDWSSAHDFERNRREEELKKQTIDEEIQRAKEVEEKLKKAAQGAKDDEF